MYTYINRTPEEDTEVETPLAVIEGVNCSGIAYLCVRERERQRERETETDRVIDSKRARERERESERERQRKIVRVCVELLWYCILVCV